MNSTSEQGAAGSLRRQTAYFILSYAVYYGIYCLFLSFMVTYLTYAGFSALFCGGAGVLTYLMGFVMQPVMGYLTDTRIPMRRCLQGAALFAMLGTAVIPAALSSAWGALLSLGFVAAFCVPMMSLLDVWVVTARETSPQLNYPLIRAGGSLGYGVISLLMGIVVERLGTGVIFPVQAVFCLGFFVVLFFLPDVPPKARRPGENSPSMIRALRAAWKDAGFRFAVGLLLLYWFTHRLMGSYLVLLVQATGGNDAVFGLVVGLGGFAEALIPLLNNAWMYRLPVHKLLLLSLLFNFARPLSFLAAVWLGTPALVLGQILQSVGFSIYFTASIEFLSRLSPEGMRNTAISSGLALSNLLGTVFANLTGGVLIDLFGPLCLIGVTLAFALLNCLWFAVRASAFPALKSKLAGS